MLGLGQQDSNTAVQQYSSTVEWHCQPPTEPLVAVALGSPLERLERGKTYSGVETLPDPFSIPTTASLPVTGRVQQCALQGAIW